MAIRLPRAVETPLAIAIGAAIALAVFSDVAGRIARGTADADAANARSSALAQQIAHGWRLRLDSTARASAAAARLIAQLDAQLAIAHARDAELAHRGDSLTAALQGSSTPTDSLRICVAGWQSCTQRVAAVQAIASATAAQLQLVGADRDRWRAGDSSAAVVTDSLGSALRRIQAASSCRILFWRCPSRTSAFGIGALIGAVATFTLTHH